MNIRNCIMFFLSFYVISFSEETLTLKKVLDLSVKQGIAPQSALIQKSQKALAVKDSRSAFLPSANTSTSGGVNGKLNSTPWQSSVNASAGVSYSYTPSEHTNYKSSVAQAEAADQQYNLSVNNTAAGAVTTYIKALYAQKKITVAENNLEYQKVKLKQIEEYRTAGKKSIADVLQQQTSVAEGEASLLDAQQEYSKNLLTLLNTLCMNPDSNVTLDTSDVSVIVPLLTSNNESVTSFSIDSLPSIMSQKLSIKSGEYLLKSKRLAYIPSLSSSANTGFGYGGTIGEEHDFSDPTGSLSIGLSYPILDQNKRKTAIQNQILNLESARLSLREIVQNAELRHRQAALDLDNARKQLEVAEARLAAAKQSLEATTERYNAGASTLIEVSMVNNSYLSAVNSRLQAESSILTASIALLQENGKIISFFGNIYK